MRRLAVVVLVALAGFAAAMVAFDDAALRGCVAEASVDSAYEVAFEQPVTADQSTQIVRIRRDGGPLADAEACMVLQLADTPATTTRSQARQLSPGRFEVSLALDEPGRWEGRALVTPSPGSAPVAVPLSVQVAPRAPTAR